ncbi:UNVERIFIED_CONTAM: hypothetical protein K2H54_016565 [Gekko kuhli]
MEREIGAGEGNSLLGSSIIQPSPERISQINSRIAVCYSAEFASVIPRFTWLGFLHRVEPALTRIKEDRKRIILPAIDNIKYNTFEVQQYANAAHGYNWGLWCMYIIPPQDWLDKGDESAPIR